MDEFKGLIDCSKVYVDKSEHGLGVFSRKDLVQDEIIEIGLIHRIKGVDGNINPYLLTWSDDRQTWAGASGCIHWYNHSFEPNVKKVGDLKNDTIKVVALKDIKAGEELRNCYMSAKWRSCFVNVLK